MTYFRDINEELSLASEEICSKINCSVHKTTFAHVRKLGNETGRRVQHLGKTREKRKTLKQPRLWTTKRSDPNSVSRFTFFQQFMFLRRAGRKCLRNADNSLHNERLFLRNLTDMCHQTVYNRKWYWLQNVLIWQEANSNWTIISRA